MSELAITASIIQYIFMVLFHCISSRNTVLTLIDVSLLKSTLFEFPPWSEKHKLDNIVAVFTNYTN